MNQLGQYELSTDVAAALERANHVFVNNAPLAALDLVNEALMLSSPLAAGWLLKGRCLVQLEDWAAARPVLERAVQLDADNAEAWMDLANVCRKLGDTAQASVAYEKSITLNPHQPEALFGNARLLLQQGQFEAARQAWRDAMAAAGQTAGGRLGQREMTLTMGRDLMDLGRLQDALTCFDLALRMMPNDMKEARAAVLVEAAACVLGQGDRERGEQWLAQAETSEKLDTLMHLSAVCMRAGFAGRGLAALERATQLHPDEVEAWAKLAELQTACWKMDDALASAAQMSALGFHDAVPSIKATIATRLGDMDTAMTIYGELVATESMPGQYACSLARCSLTSDLLPAAEVAQLHRDLFAPLGVGARSVTSFVRTPLAGRRIRLGFLAPDLLGEQPLTLLMQPLLRLIDRTRFEAFVYYTGTAQDEHTAKLRLSVEHWLDAAALDTPALATRMDADAIDVLVDLAGTGTNSRIELLAQRAAPVQVSYLGYPGTTGLPNMDVLLGDAVLTPEVDDALVSEKVIRLPGMLASYMPEDNFPLPDFATKMAGRPLTWISFAEVSSFTERTLNLWARVLAAVPASRLLIKSPGFADVAAIEHCRNRLVSLGVDPMRLEFRGPSALSQTMADYAETDIALDTVPGSGAVTALQALWMGVPVLTMQGDRYASRLGASVMQAAGLDEWVTQDDDAYVATAQRMAENRPMLLALKSTMRTRLKNAPAWNVSAHTRHFESAIEQAVKTVLY